MAHRSPLMVEDGRFTRDGMVHQVISGALHYFRVHPDLWEDRLARVRALGLNAVETYVPWNLHERRRGSLDFSGPRDVARFVGLAGDLGLDVILRPGPYICAEWDFGGLPAWLLAEPGMRLRCLDDRYTEAVASWFDGLLLKVVPFLATRGGPIVAVQVENEYGSYGDDRDYLRWCRDALVERGVDVLLVTSDGAGPDYLASGTVEGAVPTVNFGSRPLEAFAALQETWPGAAPMCMEFWNGWFDHWGEPHQSRSAAEAAQDLEAMLAAGASVNLYMAHGGTTFGLWNGANIAEGRFQPTVTSYDYDAPVGEAGELTAKFRAFREVITRHTGTVPPLPPPPLGRQAPQRVEIDGWVPLLASLHHFDPPVQGPMPLSMEELGQDHGLVLYRGEVLVPPGGQDLVLEGLADRAIVLANGRPVRTVDRDDAHPAVYLPASGTGRRTRVEILVENEGRVNYGPALGERKGVRGIRLGQRFAHGWSSVALRLDDPSVPGRLEFSEPGFVPDGPVFGRAAIDVAAPADGFLALPGWEKGFLWLNGFLLGRYWAVGPQVTLYAPAPLWGEGRNEIVVLELHRPGTGIELRDQPELGAARDPDGAQPPALPREFPANTG